MSNCEEILTPEFVLSLQPQDHLFIKESVIKALLKHRKFSNVYHNRALKMYELLKNTIVTEDPCIFHGLKWVSDSCYIDSVLMCLLSVPDSLIQKFFRQPLSAAHRHCSLNIDEDVVLTHSIRTELEKIQSFIREGTGENTCTNLRKIFSQCDTLSRFKSTYNDAGEFLTSLLSTFDEFDVCTKRIRIIHTDDFQSSPEQLKSKNILKMTVNDMRMIPVQSIENYQLTNFEDKQVKISHFLTKEMYHIPEPDSTNTVKKIFTIEKIVDTPYLVFNFQRLGPENKLNSTTIVPTEVIYLPTDTILEFTGVVTFRPSHYTCYFSCRKIWYFYNDIGAENKKIVKIGPYDELIQKHGKTIAQKGTLYFYSKIFDNLA